MQKNIAEMGIIMNIRVVLADRDEEYIENFKKSVVLNYTADLEFSFFSNEEKLKKHMFEKKCDILLIDENIAYDYEKTSTVILTDTKGVENKNGHKAVYKYQKIENIYHAIVEVYAEIKEKEGVIFHNGGHAKMISFISAGGGTGKTTVCFAVARLLKSLGKEVLYIPLEQFSDINYTRRGDETKTLSNLLYEIKIGSNALSLKIKNIIRRGADDILFLRPMDNPTEMEQMSNEEWEQMFEAISDIDDIDYMLFDHVSGVFRNFNVAVEKVNSVCLIADSTECGMVKVTEMMRFLQKSEIYHNIKQKLRIVVNRANNSSNEEFVHLKDWIVSYLPNYGTAHMQDIIEALQMQEQCKTVIDLSEN